MKQKLRLDLASLKVEPFETNPATSAGRGTVFGRATVDGGAGCDPTYAPQATCYPYNTCAGNGCAGGGSALCYPTLGCTDGTCYWTCDCANQSVEGYASCGTTCAGGTCEPGCEYYISYPGAHC